MPIARAGEEWQQMEMDLAERFPSGVRRAESEASSPQEGEVRMSFRELKIAVALLLLVLASSGCGDEDLVFPGDFPAAPTAVPTTTPTETEG